jgi:hypothetical protein
LSASTAPSRGVHVLPATVSATGEEAFERAARSIEKYRPGGDGSLSAAVEQVYPDTEST